MPFETLEEDVLLEILLFSDISTVLAVSAINKALRRIALSKQLWLSLILDIRFREALELPPPNHERLECLSAEELINVVKNAVAGPGPLWDSTYDECSSVDMTSFQIPLDDMDDRPEARILPGARYLLLNSTSTTQQTLYIYDVWSACRVWYRLMQRCKMCEVDMVPGGAIARVFFVQKGNHTNSFTLHVEEVDLITGTSRELFNFSFDSIRLDSIVFGVLPCSIGGDFLLASVVHWHSPVVLINWRASTFVCLDRDSFFDVTILYTRWYWTKVS
ncbi:hypothetical protein MSAN_01527800 [Mycena sanguinolenta]|uniref:F-box domain-containing protein n=1 Tax=Mycena sanguinolenta TaxID=230812 RepID=A0A8H6Y878_9AGAR|nr:hypothetical protein MSAN_01527800 [Mycena sanguinolenta]